MNTMTEEPSVDIETGSTPIDDTPANFVNFPEVRRDLEAQGLPGRVAGNVLDILRAVPKPWQQMTFEEQNALIGKCLGFSRDLVDEVDRAIASADRVTCVATVGKVTFDPSPEKPAKAELTVPRGDDYFFEFAKLSGQEVLVVVAGVSRLVGPSGENLQPDAPKDNQGDMFAKEADTPRFAVEVDQSGAEPDYLVKDIDDNILLHAFGDEGRAYALRNALAERFAGREAQATRLEIDAAVLEIMDAAAAAAVPAIEEPKKATRESTGKVAR